MASDPHGNRVDPYALQRAPEIAPLAGTRDEAMQRLRIGIGGLVGMVILIGLATIIYERANQIDATAVPEAAPTIEPNTATPKNDPLANAGVVPDLPAEPTASPTQEQAVMPEQGDAVPAQ